MDKGRSPPSEKYYITALSNFKSSKLMSMQTNHIMVLFFFIGGLNILEKQYLIEQKQLKNSIVQYILSLQLANGGFTCSTLYSKLNQSSCFAQGHIVFTYSALNCLQILGSIGKIDKDKILNSISKHQKQDGSFSSFQYSTECDLRFVYSALSICALLGSYKTINQEKALEYIKKCSNFDGGFGLRPNDQSHSGAIYCAVASYQHLNYAPSIEQKLKIIDFLMQRIVELKYEQQNYIGIQGRVGKDPDSCYGFWVGASLKILCKENLLPAQVGDFIRKCFKKQQCSFSKYIESKYGDPVHTFHSITALRILENTTGNLSLHSLIRASNYFTQK